MVSEPQKLQPLNLGPTLSSPENAQKSRYHIVTDENPRQKSRNWILRQPSPVA